MCSPCNGDRTHAESERKIYILDRVLAFVKAYFEMYYNITFARRTNYRARRKILCVAYVRARDRES